MAKISNSSRDSQVPGQNGGVESTVVLCDTSSSMGEFAGGRTRIDILRDVLKGIVPEHFTGQVWEFNSFLSKVPGPPYRPGVPSGGTDLAGALKEFLEAGLRPRPLIVISDGIPNDGEAALKEARKLKTFIITRFVGPDEDFAAIAFMRALAWCSDDGLGDAQVHSWERPEALRSDLATLLLQWEGGR